MRPRPTRRAASARGLHRPKHRVKALESGFKCCPPSDPREAWGRPRTRDRLSVLQLKQMACASTPCPVQPTQSLAGPALPSQNTLPFPSLQKRRLTQSSSRGQRVPPETSFQSSEATARIVRNYDTTS